MDKAGKRDATKRERARLCLSCWALDISQKGYHGAVIEPLHYLDP